MNDATNKKLFKEIASALNDFYMTEACDFIKGLQKQEAWYRLPASQIKRLQDIFAQADEDSARKKTNRNEAREKKLNEFLLGQNERRRGQAKKELRKGAEPFWQILLESPKNLLAFLFHQDEKFFAELQRQAQTLVSLREQQYPDSLDIQTYLAPAADQKSELYHWQRHELLPLITEKLFYTLLTLHRLRNAECYQDKERKDWLPCKPLTN